MKILILDDSTVRLQKFKEYLINFEVLTAKTAKEAISLIDENHPEVIFLDHDLGTDHPDDNGMTVAKHISSLVVKDHPELVLIHTMNTTAAVRMSNIVSTASMEPIICPYGLIDFDRLVTLLKERFQKP